MYNIFEALKFATVALILVCVQPAMPDNPSIASKPGYVYNQEKLLDHFNDRRRKYAKEKNFARMFKLEWDDSLGEKAKTKDDDGLLISYRPYIDWPQDQKALKSLEDYNVQFSKMEGRQLIEEGIRYQLGSLEIILPGQKRVGCSDHIFDYHGDKFKLRCHLAPEGKFNTYGEVNGPAGSKCPSDYHNDDGLCAPGKFPFYYYVIGGCIAGAGVVLCIVVGIVVFCILKKKKKKTSEGGTTATGTGITGAPGPGTAATNPGNPTGTTATTGR